jgi:hypothetical protein
MASQIQQMTVDEFAECRIALGDRVQRHGRVWWLRTRGVFYRPLLPYEAYSLTTRDLPPDGLGGFQYVVSNQHEANSSTGFLMLEGVQDYSFDALGHNRRRLIKNAAKSFVIRPITDKVQFKDEGFEAYSSFYRRTRYDYKSDRTRRANYSGWVDAVLSCSKALVLGGFEPRGRLEAVSISYWVSDTLIYATFFSQTQALRNGVGELMFHHLRETAREAAGIREAYVRPYQGGNGMDTYYLLRGAKLVVKPARVCLHGVTKMLLRLCFPARYAALGIVEQGPVSSAHRPSPSISSSEILGKE